MPPMANTLGYGFDYQPPIRSPSRIYEVGKFKEYRQLVGMELIRNHIEGNAKDRRRIGISPNEDLENIKFKKGHQISTAIDEIIFNLEKFEENAKEEQRLPSFN